MCQIITYFSILYFTFHPFGYHILLNIWFFLSFFFTCQDLSDKTASPSFKNDTSCLDNCALFGNYIVHLNYRQYLWFFLNKKKLSYFMCHKHLSNQSEKCIRDEKKWKFVKIWRTYICKHQWSCKSHHILETYRCI